MRHRLPIHTEHSREVHVGADAKAATFERGVHFVLVADLVVADTDQRIPHTRLPLELGLVGELHVVFEGKTADAGGEVEVRGHLHAARHVVINGVHVDPEERQLRAVAADRGPQAIGVDAEPALRRREATQVGTVEAAVDDLSGAAAAANATAAVDRWHVQVDADAERHPGEDRVDRHLPVIVVRSAGGS